MTIEHEDVTIACPLIFAFFSPKLIRVHSRRMAAGGGIKGAESPCTRTRGGNKILRWGALNGKKVFEKIFQDMAQDASASNDAPG